MMLHSCVYNGRTIVDVFTECFVLTSIYYTAIKGFKSQFPRPDYKTATELQMSPIGFVGLGIMGEGMAARLLTERVAGSEDSPLVIWNRTGSKCTTLAEKFANRKVIIKPTAREVVETCEITYSMLSTPEVSKVVFEGDDGVLAGVSPGKSIVDCATLAEDDMKRMNDAVVSKGG